MAASASSRFEFSAHGAPIGPGRVVLIVGPSGAGKDAILQEVRGRLAGDPRVMFPKRIVTREPNAAEDHDTLMPADFESRLACGGFALHWEAHGLSYGIPSAIDDAVRSGATVAFNASRCAVPAARARYVVAAVVLIDAPLHVRVERLAARGREYGEDAAARLERVAADFSTADCDLVINNTGTLARAADALVAWLEANSGARSIGAAS